jgi:hypothetical protein
MNEPIRTEEPRPEGREERADIRSQDRPKAYSTGHGEREDFSAAGIRQLRCCRPIS